MTLSACARATAGPLGQCHPIPDDVGIRQEMLQAAQNYAHIYSLYNFDYDPEPGTAQWRIDQRIKRVRAAMGPGASEAPGDVVILVTFMESSGSAHPGISDTQRCYVLCFRLWACMAPAPVRLTPRIMRGACRCVTV